MTRKNLGNKPEWWCLRSANSDRYDTVACVVYDGYVSSDYCDGKNGVIQTFII